MLHGHLHRCVLGHLSPSASSADGAALKSPMMTVGPIGKLSVGLHEVFEECLRGVSKGDMYVDDIQAATLGPRVRMPLGGLLLPGVGGRILGLHLRGIWALP